MPTAATTETNADDGAGTDAFRPVADRCGAVVPTGDTRARGQALARPIRRAGGGAAR